MARKATKSVEAAKVETKAVEVKAEATPAVEVKEEVKAEAAKAEETKAAAKKTTKAAAKTTTAKKETTTAKKTTAKVEEKVVLQLGFGEYTTEDVVDMCKKAYEAENTTKIKTIDVYVKPEDQKAYYVVNGKVAGAVEL